MRVLLVKTSSLGDVVHALPAVTEAAQKVPGLVFDWVVEDSFAAIPALHPAVNRVIPVSVRRWRKHWLASRLAVSQALKDIRSARYDLVIDSQGLFKSAFIALAARGRRHGFSRHSAREPLAAVFYQQGYRVEKQLHAIHRQKQLLAAALGYDAGTDIDYGLRQAPPGPAPSVMFLHGTTWRTKEWPLACWTELAARLASTGVSLMVPAGNEDELERANLILAGYSGEILDRIPLATLIDRMRSCSGVVSVDTGLGHLAPALGLPTVGIFGATDPELTGILGPATSVLASTHLPCIPCRKRDCQYQKSIDSSNIYPPCYQQTSPEKVWQVLQRLIGSRNTLAG